MRRQEFPWIESGRRGDYYGRNSNFQVPNTKSYKGRNSFKTGFMSGYWSLSPAIMLLQEIVGFEAELSLRGGLPYDYLATFIDGRDEAAFQKDQINLSLEIFQFLRQSAASCPFREKSGHWDTPTTKLSNSFNGAFEKQAHALSCIRSCNKSFARVCSMMS